MADPAQAPPLVVRAATPADLGTILQFIHDLACYEQLEHSVVATEEDLRRSLFGEPRTAEVLLAFEGVEPAGFALFFPNFSTFLGRPGLYLEDLFVRDGSRGRGIGRALLARLAGIAVERGWGRVEWAVLEWNRPAVRFYESLGAIVMHDWRLCRLAGPALARLAGGTPRSEP